MADEPESIISGLDTGHMQRSVRLRTHKFTFDSDVQQLSARGLRHATAAPRIHVSCDTVFLRQTMPDRSLPVARSINGVNSSQGISCRRNALIYTISEIDKHGLPSSQYHLSRGREVTARKIVICTVS